MIGSKFWIYNRVNCANCICRMYNLSLRSVFILSLTLRGDVDVIFTSLSMRVRVTSFLRSFCEAKARHKSFLLSLIEPLNYHLKCGSVVVYTWIINSSLNDAVQCETIFSNFVTQFFINVFCQNFRHVIIVCRKVWKICISWKVLVGALDFLITGHCEWRE